MPIVVGNGLRTATLNQEVTANIEGRWRIPRGSDEDTGIIQLEAYLYCRNVMIIDTQLDSTVSASL